MNKPEFVTKITRGLHGAGLKLKTHSPEILVVGGAVGVVISAVMACKASTKVSDVIEEMHDNIDKAHRCVDNPNLKDAEGNSVEYTETDMKKDIIIVYTNTAIDLVKLYAPAVVLGIASLSCIVTSNRILHKRNIALAAAYTAVDKSFKEYRSRVVDRFGEALDEELRYNIKVSEVEDTITDENGEEKVVKKTVTTAGDFTLTDTDLIFDPCCRGFEKDAFLNKKFLLLQQAYANDLLRARGHVFLNEIYDLLGAQRTPEGNIIGWLYRPNDPDHKGDNNIDFGLTRDIDTPKINFVNGYEHSVILRFNHDGTILDKI